MSTEDIRDALKREPFEPFRIRVTSGDHYEVRDPLSAAMMKSRLFVALPHSDRSVFIPYLHIAAVETLNGSGHRARRKRRQ
ncbi:MAG: hypothetical protein HZA51_13380 [Planctomycetes bacterium]|nr:hypothetical protein [Planctomycetota bacterium]